MSPSRHAPSLDPAASVRELPGSPPNEHRVCVHGHDVLWIAVGDDRVGVVDGDARDRTELSRFVAESLRTERWAALVERLGLDFTIAASLAGVPEILCTRGPASRVPLYVAARRSRGTLATRLWHEGDPSAPRPAFMRHVLANACLPSPSEPDHTLETASCAWLRTPRGAVLGWRDGRARLLGRYGCPSVGSATVRDEAATDARLRVAVDDRIRTLGGRCRFATELSGGIDSGIVAARAAALLPERFVGGITLIAPYHELRRERTFVDATLAHARTRTRFVPIDAHLPFAGLAKLPLHDEPSLSSLAGSLLTGVLRAARELGAETVCHGIGGDQVFANQCPDGFAALSGWRDGLGFADPSLRLVARAARRQLRHLYFGGVRCLRRSPAFLLHDGWYDRYLAPAVGVKYEGVFVDLLLLRICDALRADRRTRDTGLPKSIPRRAFAGELAPVVLERRGKAGFDGVYQRGLRRNIDEVCGLVEAEARSLAEAHVDTARLIGRLRDCAARGWGSRDTPAFAALAWAAWMHALRHGGRASDGARQ
jgi:asparagine synthetase B (glutamine-hydrolysing)